MTLLTRWLVLASRLRALFTSRRLDDDLDREISAHVALLTEDAWWTMPPDPFGYQGRDAIRRFIGRAFAAQWDHPRRLVPTRSPTRPPASSGSTRS